MTIKIVGRHESLLFGRSDTESVGRAGGDRFINVSYPEIANVPSSCKDRRKSSNSQEFFPHSHWYSSLDL